MQFIKKDPRVLKPHPRNSRKHSEKQIERIENSIKEFGFTNPILLDDSGMIVAGHARQIAAINLNMVEVPCVHLSNLTPEQIQAYVVADNRLAELSEGDMDILSEELKEIDFNFDLELVGWEGFKFSDEDEISDCDNEFSEEVEPRTKLGDVWLLGDHKLMCGDALDTETLQTLMDGELADLAHNDPPYGMCKNIMNDNMNFNDLLEFNKQWIPLQLSFMKPNASWYCWGTDEPLMDIYSNILKPYFNEQKATFRNLITWDKGSIAGQRSEVSRMYQPADEKCLFMMLGKQTIAQTADAFPKEWEPIYNYMVGERDKLGWSTADVVAITGKSSASHYFTKSQFAVPTKEHYAKIQAAAQGKAFLEDFHGLNKASNKLMDEFRATRAYFDGAHDNFNNVWHFSRVVGADREEAGGHDTPKPIDLCARIIKTSCPEGGLVIDYFGGSGSTLIACERLNRKCYMLELDPKYCDVIIARWEKISGEVATLQQ